MALNMSPRTGGVISAGCGVFFIGLTVYWACSEGVIYLFPCIAGPAILPISVALIVLPIQRLYQPTEIGGKMVYDSSNSNPTPLGVGLLWLGFCGSGALYLILKYGL